MTMIMTMTMTILFDHNVKIEIRIYNSLENQIIKIGLDTTIT